MSDAILVFHDGAACDEQDSARRFLQMLGAAYRQLDAPETQFRDWVARANRTLRDLETAPEATIRHYGHPYIHPYTAAEYPDVMVQMAIIAPLRNYAAWSGQDIPFCAALESGLEKFHDAKLKTMRRYLPNVGKDKDKLAVDSWYLYHPLLNLGHLALDGDARARRLFTGSLGFAVSAARHFAYAWPIQFKVVGEASARCPLSVIVGRQHQPCPQNVRLRPAEVGATGLNRGAGRHGALLKDVIQVVTYERDQ